MDPFTASSTEFEPGPLNVPATPGISGTPPDYRWSCAWPEAADMRWLSASAPMLAVAVICFAIGIATDSSVEVPVALFIAALGVIAIVAGFTFRAGLSPAVHYSEQPTTFLLRYPRSRLRLLSAVAGFGIIAAAALWIGAREANIELVLGGTALVVVSVFVTITLLRLRRNAELALSPGEIRVTTRYCDWEFPWTAITAISASDDGRGAAAIAIRCRRDQMIARPAPRRTPARWLAPRRSKDGPWKIIPAMWGVTPNSLLSTLNYLSADPARRVALTREQLTSMLTPPPLPVRRALTEQLPSGSES
ncbi:hypothetical protein [Nocardia sp. NPDC050175]|uniref:hypothetical protein n=1 Tax=Nocardia sp. NPDC050175 TaxID=3364317 RepID=UPI0037A4D90C